MKLKATTLPDGLSASERKNAMPSTVVTPSGLLIIISSNLTINYENQNENVLNGKFSDYFVWRAGIFVQPSASPIAALIDSNDGSVKRCRASSQSVSLTLARAAHSDVAFWLRENTLNKWNWAKQFIRLHLDEVMKTLILRISWALFPESKLSLSILNALWNIESAGPWQDVTSGQYTKMWVVHLLEETDVAVVRSNEAR